MALFLGLGFEDADGFGVHEEHVVGESAFDVGLAQGDSGGSVEIEAATVLNKPTRREEHRVNSFAGFLFWRVRHRERWQSLVREQRKAGDARARLKLKLLRIVRVLPC